LKTCFGVFMDDLNSEARFLHKIGSQITTPKFPELYLHVSKFK